MKSKAEVIQGKWFLQTTFDSDLLLLKWYKLRNGVKFYARILSNELFGFHGNDCIKIPFMIQW